MFEQMLAEYVALQAEVLWVIVLSIGLGLNNPPQIQAPVELVQKGV